MKVVIGVTPVDRYEFIPLPPPEWNRLVRLSVAKVIVPHTFNDARPIVLYTSPPRLPLNACANAVRWAEKNGHTVLGGTDAAEAII